MAKVKLNRRAMNADTKRAATRWANRIGNRIVAEARQTCPVDEGTLRASITHVAKVKGKTATVVVGSPLPYAEYLHAGTGVHGPKGTPIVPVEREALKFKWDGPGKATRSKDKRGFVFAKSVQGVKPNPFLADALENVMGTIQRRNT